MYGKVSTTTLVLWQISPRKNDTTMFNTLQLDVNNCMKQGQLCSTNTNTFNTVNIITTTTTITYMKW